MEQQYAAPAAHIGANELLRFGPVPEPDPIRIPIVDPETGRIVVSHYADDIDAYIQRIQWRMLQRVLLAGTIGIGVGLFFGWAANR